LFRNDTEAKELQQLLADPQQAFRSRPLSEIGALRTLVPAWQDWLEHQSLVHRGRLPAGPGPDRTLVLGAAPIGNLYRAISDEQAAAAVHAAWQGGVRYFDTAPHDGLGLSERRLSAALADYPRADYVISTKVGRILEPNPAPSGSDLANLFDVPDERTRRRDYTADGSAAA
jgi:hypothetical protein